MTENSLLQKALDRRSQIIQGFDSAQTNAYRLFDGEGDGVDGLFIDRYGSCLVFSVHDGVFRYPDTFLKAWAEQCLQAGLGKSVYLKRQTSDRSREQAASDPTPFAGVPAEETFTVQENGHFFRVKPYDGFMTGIFLDQRENRRHLGEQGARKRVLNCFAYTCAFSVVCAANGAITTSVDLSKKYLNWGRENFRLNGLDESSHRFFESDTFRFFKAAEKRSETYDLIILDPPSFSRNHKGRIFSIKKDLEKLIAAAIPSLAASSRLFFSTNFSEWDTATLMRLSEGPLNRSGRRWRFEDTPGTPEDYRCLHRPISYFLARFE